MKFLSKLYKGITKITEPIPSVFLAILVAITFANVVLRYCFNAPLPWAEEVEALLYTFIVFFGLSITHRLGSAVSVDIITTHFSAKLRRVVALVSTTLTLFLWVVVTYLGAKLALRTQNSYTSYLLIPYRYIYWFIPISGALDIIQLTHRLYLICSGKDFGKKSVTDEI